MIRARAKENEDPLYLLRTFGAQAGRRIWDPAESGGPRSESEGRDHGAVPLLRPDLGIKGKVDEKGMIHKKEGMPSKGWLCHYLSRYYDQRVTFEIAQGSRWWKLCTDAAVKDEPAFKKDEPLYFSGVYEGLMKRPENWPSWNARGPAKLYLRFRGASFIQADRKAGHPLARSHYQQRRRDVEFELSEIRGLGLAERLASMIPRLGHSPGRLNCSEGSSERGFPSTKEPAPPSRGSNLSEDLE